MIQKIEKTLKSLNNTQNTTQIKAKLQKFPQHQETPKLIALVILINQQFFKNVQKTFGFLRFSMKLSESTFDIINAL